MTDSTGLRTRVLGRGCHSPDLLMEPQPPPLYRWHLRCIEITSSPAPRW